MIRILNQDPTPPRLIIVCGLPGSGKTTRARLLERDLPAVRFCADEWMDALGINLWQAEFRDRIEKLQWKIAQDILRLGRSVVIEWGTWSKAERDALRTRARELGAGVELHYLDAAVEVLYDRIRLRKMEEPPITLADLRRWADLFGRPSLEELALFDPPA